MADKTPNYSPASVAAILAAVAANNNVANGEVAAKLVDHKDMLDNDGNKRTARAIIAKMRRMVETEGFTYERKQPTTKDGKPVTKKTDLVARIARAAGVTAASLDGLDKAPKLALDTLTSVMEAFAAEDEDDATGTEG